MARATNKSLANLAMLESLKPNEVAPQPTMPTMNIGGQVSRTSNKSEEQDLAGQEAFVDRKIAQSGTNAITRSRAWDVLGDIIGYKTQTDYIDQKSRIDAEQGEIARQAQAAAEQAAIKQMAEKQAREQFATDDLAGFTEQALNVKPATPEDGTMISNFIIDREVATGMIRSADPEIQKKGYERLTANDLAWKAYQQKNEEQAIQKGQWGQEQKVREGTLAETRRDNIARLGETRRHNQTTERLQAEQQSAARVATTRNTFYEQSAKQYALVQGVINDVNAALWEASANNNPTALVSAQKKLAKLTDPTTGVLQGEMRDQLNSTVGATIARAQARGAGNLRREDLEDIQGAAMAADRSSRDTYKRELEYARSQNQRDGLPADTLDSTYDPKPLFSGQGYGIAPDDEEDKLTYGDRVGSMVETVTDRMEAARKFIPFVGMGGN